MTQGRHCDDGELAGPEPALVYTPGEQKAAAVHREDTHGPDRRSGSQFLASCNHQRSSDLAGQ